jgi:hypothetical protein
VTKILTRAGVLFLTGTSHTCHGHQFETELWSAEAREGIEVAEVSTVRLRRAVRYTLQCTRDTHLISRDLITITTNHIHAGMMITSNDAILDIFDTCIVSKSAREGAWSLVLIEQVFTNRLGLQPWSICYQFVTEYFCCVPW